MSRHGHLCIGLFALLLIGSMLPSSSFLTPPSIPRVHAASRSIQLTGAFGTGWNGTNPGPTITVTRGDSVSMTLISGDSPTPHTFIVDVDKDGVISNPICSVDKCSPQFPPTTTFPFTVDFGPGTYTYYCSIHLTAMVGNFVVQGPDFTVSSNPSSLTIPQGSNDNSTVTVASLGNFAGPITLSAAPSPSGPTTIFSVNPVMVPAAGTATSKLTISIPAATSPGSYSVTVTGKNSTVTHTASVSLTVTSSASPDFTVSSNPTSLTIAQGSSGTSTITVTSINGFSGTVNLAAAVSPTGPQVSVSPTSVILSFGGSPTSSLTVSATSSGLYSPAVSTGSYTVTVTGTGSSLSRSASVSLTVGSTSSPPPGVGSLPTSLIIGVIVAAVAAVAVAIYIIRRKPKT